MSIRMSKSNFYLFFALLSFSVSVRAQQESPKKLIYLGLSSNAYKGDLSNSYQGWSPGAHIGLWFNKKDKRINGNLNLMLGRVQAQNGDYFFDDGSSPSPSPNTFASTTMVAVHYQLNYNLIKKDRFRIYLYQGIGLLRYNPRDQFKEKLSDQLATRARDEAYNNLSIILPHGIGAMYILKQGFTAGVQLGWQGLTTDYIDNISQWGTRKKSDSVFQVRLMVAAPMRVKS